MSSSMVMAVKVTLVLYGEHALKHGSRLEFEAVEGETVEELLGELHIGTEGHHLLVNERKVGKDHVLKDGDVLKILPFVYGG